MTHDQRKVRRALLQGLAASPFVALGAGLPILARPEKAPSVMHGEIFEALSANVQLITAPNEAINVFNFDAVARQRLSPAHYGYLATGTDNDATVRANRAGFDRFQLRARRLTGIREIDLSCEFFGTRYASPIVLAPVGNTRAFHDEGIVVAARAAQLKRVAQILSIGADTSLDAANRARGEPAWFQLYPVGGWPYIEAILRRAESVGCPVLVLTVDLNAGSNRETRERLVRLDDADCAACNRPGRPQGEKYPITAGIEVPRNAPPVPALNWDFVDRLRDSTDMKLLIKGIRGTDIFKALALGADAVCIGRPYIWGLAAFGQDGVETVLDILNRELALVMRQCGTAALEQVGRDALV